MQEPKSIAVVGTGPSGLMAASVISRAGHSVHLYEKKSAPGRKLLVAGSSGLNISFETTQEECLDHYSGPRQIWNKIFSSFSPKDWTNFIHHLGFETFTGTSKRAFLKDWKAARFLKEWTLQLKAQGVQYHFNEEVKGFDCLSPTEIELQFSRRTQTFSAVCFCLGGGSWERAEKPLRWPNIFTEKGIKLSTFQAANVGWRVAWPSALLKEAEGLPVKNVRLTTSLGTKEGELVITSYGLEGTPIYTLGTRGQALLDLKPNFSEEQILAKLQTAKENLSPIRRADKYLKLSRGSLALLYHCTSKEDRSSIHHLAKRVKELTLSLLESQPIDEAISSKGGISWDELDESLMVKKYPRIFLAGEMIDWTAPTGGYLIQGCVSQGYFVGQKILELIG